MKNSNQVKIKKLRERLFVFILHFIKIETYSITRLNKMNFKFTV